MTSGDVDLSESNLDQACRREPSVDGESAIVECNLFALTGFSGCFGPNDPLPGEGVLGFHVDFDYVPGIYDALSYSSEEQRIRLGSIPPRGLPADDAYGIGSFEVDNAVLATSFDESSGLVGATACPPPSFRLVAGGGATPEDADADRQFDQNRAINRELKRRAAERERIKQENAAREAALRAQGIVAAIALTLGLAVAGAIVLWRRMQIPFDPGIDLPDRLSAEVDFNASRHAGAKMLLATPMIVNRGQPKIRLPWHWLQPGQPHRFGRIECRYGLDPCLKVVAEGLGNGQRPLIGFAASPEDQGGPLSRARGSNDDESLQLSDGAELHLFMDPDAILDLLDHPGDGGPAQLELPVNIAIEWQDGGPVERELPLDLRVLPERVVDPIIQYRPLGDDPRVLHFQNDPPERDPKLLCGHYRIRSQATHLFAATHGEVLDLLAFCEERPLDAGAIGFGTGLLSEQEIRVAPDPTRKSALEIPVYLECDGNLIPNPDPTETAYGFRIAARESEAHRVLLRRDQTESRLELKVQRGREAAKEVYFDDQGMANSVRIDSETGKRDRALPVADGVLLFEPWKSYHKFSIDRGSASTGADFRHVFQVTLANSARFGRGHIEVEASLRVEWSGDEVLGSVIWCSRKGPADLVRLEEKDPSATQSTPAKTRRDADGFRWSVDIPESPEPNPRRIEVGIDCGAIKRLRDGRIEHEEATLVLGLDIEVVTDQGAKTRRRLSIRHPMGLEEAPRRDWLCVDFGTSAIAVAVGRPSWIGQGLGDAVELIDLQQVRQPDGSYLARFDDRNTEEGTPFLPSFIACDAYSRTDAGIEAGYQPPNPGFPHYLPADQEPGWASFLSLPATRKLMEEDPRSILYSLKSWLAQGSDVVPVRVLDGGSLVERELKINRMLHSAFDALLQAYLLPHGIEDVGRVIVTCPNTFTEYHRRVLAAAARFVFCRGLDIPLDERISLVSESDAAAFEYIRRSLGDDGFDPPDLQHLMVYDFGAGTLDLSVLRIHWTRGQGAAPGIKAWEVIARLGLPLAGNHLDSLLARLVHNRLTDGKILGPNDGARYLYPIVADHRQVRTPLDHPERHRKAALNLWGSIRQAKAVWDGKDPMQIRVGIIGDNEPYQPMVVGRKNQLQSRRDAPSPTVCGIWCREGDFFDLQVPAHEIHQDARISAYFDLVTDTLIEECLGMAGISSADVHNLVLAGRSTQWPGLREQLARRLPNAQIEDACAEDGSIGLKKAVARGAIARQVQKELGTKLAEDVSPRFCLVFESSDQARIEPLDPDREEAPIPWGTDDHCYLVQVVHRMPTPADLEDTYRRYFFLRASREFERERGWDDGGDILVSWDPDHATDAKAPAYLHSTTDTALSISVYARADQAAEAVRPPWPVGRYLLSAHEIA